MSHLRVCSLTLCESFSGEVLTYEWAKADTRTSHWDTADTSHWDRAESFAFAA